MVGSRPFIQSLFAGFSPGRVLDFGGGGGETAAAVQSAGHDVTLMDFDAGLLAAAEKRGLRTIQGDEKALDNLEETFDYALLSHIVEHIQCPHESLLPRIHNRLREGGRVVVAVPNAARLRNRVALLLGKFSDGMVYQHVRFFTQTSLRAELEKAGFRVIAEHGFAYDRPTRLATRFSPNFGDELIVVAERPPGPDREVPDAPTWAHM